MDFSFVILSWNSKDHLIRCLASIDKQLHDQQLKYEIFVVDNGSDDGSVELLKAHEASIESKVVPIFLGHNTGTTYSRNLALNKSIGDYIVVLDSDVELHTNTVETLRDVLVSLPDAGMVVPKLVYGSGRLQKSTDVFPTLARKIERLLFLKKMENQEDQQGVTDKIVEVDYAISAFWVFPRTMINKVGLLDERIFYAPEDVDYCIRIWKAGYRILYVPDAIATHYAQEISRGFKINKAKIEHIKGLVYYFWKHRYLFRRPEFKNLN